MESLPIRTEKTFVNTKHQTKLRYLADIALPLLGIAVLNILPNTAVKDVFNYSTQMQETGDSNHIYF